jgi:hypothetical protein
VAFSLKLWSFGKSFGVQQWILKKLLCMLLKISHVKDRRAIKVESAIFLARFTIYKKSLICYNKI